jgi:hypothetical protein
MMITVVGSCIVKILDKYKDAQINLGSEAAQMNIASEILDEILFIIDKKKDI